MFGLILNAQLLFDGAVTGLTYGMLAAGLVLIHRSSGIINFAYAEVGAFSAAFLALATIQWNWPFLAAFPVAVLAGAAMSAVIELTVIRRLFDAPRVIVLIATVGVAELVLLCRIVLPDVEGFHRYPAAFDGRWDLGPLTVRSEQLVVLVAVPVMVGALAWFLSRTLTGMAIRGVASNAEACRLMGIDVKRMSTLVWTLAGFLSAVSAIVVRPLEGVPVAVGAPSLDARLLVVALAAGLVGRLRSMPIALVAGVAIGTLERILLVNHPEDPGLITAVLLVVVLVASLTGADGGDTRRTRWSFAGNRAPVDPRIAGHWLGRHLHHVAAAVAVAVAALLPVVVTVPSRQQLYAEVLIVAIVALSVTVLTGWAGQLSLGQFAFAGVGAFTAAAAMREGAGFGFAVVLAGLVSTLLAVLVGLPSLRVRGLLLAITTLAFAVFTHGWLLDLDIFDDGRPSVRIPRTIENGIDFGVQRTYYWLCLVVLVVAALVAARIRRRGLGRMLIAVRDNEPAAAAMTVSQRKVKMVAFALGGTLAGVAGALLGGLLGRFDVTAFAPGQSVRVVAVAVIGGLGSVTGAVLGAVWVIGLPALLGRSPEVSLATSGVGLLVLLMYFPGGLVQLLENLRRAVLARVARRLPEPAPVVRPPIPAPVAAVAPGEGPALEVEDVRVAFGGNVAVDGVSLVVHAGEIVGLIGANGAGKTTLMNAVGGYVPSTGRVRMFGTDLSGLPSATRARLGLGRAFQNAELFPELTVRETVQLALERRLPTSIVGTLVGTPGAARRQRAQRAQADDLIDFLGLGRYAESVVGNLSTGTRRITELSCLLALGAPMVCLDEPTAGVAQKETEAFGPLLQEIRTTFGMSMLLIEHDMPLVLGVSDRVYCMEAGRVIASGLPDDVRQDPAVVASYLGTDDRAILRSGAT